MSAWSKKSVCARAEQLPDKFRCFGCGTDLVKQSAVYCSRCIASWQLEFSEKARECQNRVDEMQAKLLLKGSAEAGLLEALKQKELLLLELQHKIDLLTRTTMDI